jgi:hypothetical protein
MTDRKDPTQTEVDDLLNPHRAQEQERAREHAIDVLSHRGVHLAGDETDDELARLWSAVERFELAVEARGGDTLTNSLDSAEPDNPAFVPPVRRPDEPAREYIDRILEAAAALRTVER